MEMLQKTPQVLRPAMSWKRRTYRLCVIIGITFLGANLILLALENWLLFHPDRASPTEWVPPPNIRVRDLELHLAEGTKIHAWWFPLANWKPEDGATLYLHGNAGNLSQRGLLLEQWQREMGQAILIVDYPGFGRSEGSPNEAGCCAAADVAYDWLTQEQAVPPASIILYGGSLGGAVAVDLASRREHRAMVLVDTFASITEMAHLLFPYLPLTRFVHNKFDSLSKIGNCTKPIFQIHRVDDQVVPYEQGKRLFDAANQPKCFVKLPGSAHEEGLPNSLHEQFRRFLQEAEAPTRGAVPVGAAK